MKQIVIAFFLAIFSQKAALAIPGGASKQAILTDAKALKAIGLKSLVESADGKIAYAELSEKDLHKLHQASHKRGACAGFEALEPKTKSDLKEIFRNFELIEAKHQASLKKFSKSLQLNEKISEAVKQINPNEIESNVRWLSSFPNRYARAENPNIAVHQLKDRIANLLKNTPHAQVELVKHRTLRQDSIRIRLEGRSRPQEIIVAGGHLDSIVGWGGGNVAPGADDNASGVSTLLEALRVFITQKRPERSVEIMLYAGEELGLIGSSEIATEYKNSGRDVVSVLQLDMTLFPGNGELTMGFMQDFTHPLLNQYFEKLNEFYVGARVLKDECGYGCSDHASWHRQGYAAMMPFEATFDGSNSNIHTSSDVVDHRSSFTHAAAFAKLALAYLMEFGDNSIRL